MSAQTDGEPASCWRSEEEESGNSSTPTRKKLRALDIELHERLGRGSYGSVFRATAGHLGQVAVKVLPWSPTEISHDLIRELKLLQRCTSPHICRAFGAFSKPAELWIVLEICDLGSLRDVMRCVGSPLPSEMCIATACRDVLRGLDYLHTHRKRIIHRDIKCANLLLSAGGGGSVKLADVSAR